MIVSDLSTVVHIALQMQAESDSVSVGSVSTPVYLLTLIRCLLYPVMSRMLFRGPGPLLS